MFLCSCRYEWKGADGLKYLIAELVKDSESEPEGDPATDRSLRGMNRLTQRFTVMFMKSNGTLELEEVAVPLFGLPPDEKDIKAKVRRLYDIANVMEALGLIKREQSRDESKTKFLWIGPDNVRETIQKARHVDPEYISAWKEKPSAPMYELNSLPQFQYVFPGIDPSAFAISDQFFGYPNHLVAMQGGEDPKQQINQVAGQQAQMQAQVAQEGQKRQRDQSNYSNPQGNAEGSKRQDVGAPQLPPGYSSWPQIMLMNPQTGEIHPDARQATMPQMQYFPFALPMDPEMSAQDREKVAEQMRILQKGRPQDAEGKNVMQ